jgi:formyl-CoA transferase
METSATSSKALQGVKVLDLTQYEAGTTVTQALAWFGADVVKIEEPTQGDQGRFSNTNIPGIDSHYFMMLNCNKRSVTMNLRSERGKDLLRRMIPKADIFIENFAPGTIERLGFSYEAVSAINPGIIYTQIKGFAPDGPYAKYLSFDMIAQAMGGIMSATGEIDGIPLKVGPSLGDSGTAMHCLSSVLAALYQRSVTGIGQRIEVAMQDAMLSFMRVQFANQYVLGTPQPRTGNRFKVGTWVTPGNIYHCKPFGPNDYCYIYSSRAHNKHWESLLKAIGREDLMVDPRFSTHAARAEHHQEVDQLLGEWTRNYTKHEVMQILGEAGVPTGAVLDTEELLAAPDMRKRGIIATINHPVRGELAVPGWPVKMSRSPVEVVSPPLLGEHNAEVYGEWLGIDEGEVAQLREEKVI